MLTLSANGADWPDWKPFPKARTTKFTGAKDSAFRWLDTQTPLPRDFNRSTKKSLVSLRCLLCALQSRHVQEIQMLRGFAAVRRDIEPVFR